MMPSVSGKISFIDEYFDGTELFIQLELPDGEIISIGYDFNDERIAAGLYERLELDMLVTCKIKENINLDSDEAYSGFGTIKIYNFHTALDGIFDGFFNEKVSTDFTSQEKDALRLFCIETPKLMKQTLNANAEQSAVIDNEFRALSIAIGSLKKKEWKKKFIASMVNVAAAFAIDQALGTAFIMTLAEIVKQAIQNLTGKFIAKKQD